MFFFTYVPQLAIMVFTSGPAAPLTTALLVLSESQTLFNILSKNFVIEEALIDTFDGVSSINTENHTTPIFRKTILTHTHQTLVARDQTHIVQEGRQVNASGKDVIGKLGKSTTAQHSPPIFFFSTN